MLNLQREEGYGAKNSNARHHWPCIRQRESEKAKQSKMMSFSRRFSLQSVKCGKKPPLRFDKPESIDGRAKTLGAGGYFLLVRILVPCIKSTIFIVLVLGDSRDNVRFGRLADEEEDLEVESYPGIGTKVSM